MASAVASANGLQPGPAAFLKADENHHLHCSSFPAPEETLPVCAIGQRSTTACLPHNSRWSKSIPLAPRCIICISQ